LVSSFYVEGAEGNSACKQAFGNRLRCKDNQNP